VIYNYLTQDIVTGGFESGLSQGLAKFDQMVELCLLEIVYQEPSCVAREPLTASECPPNQVVMDKIYRVNPDAEFDTSPPGG
ncbi:MAG TPA: hypothetical protein VJZ27_03345, partial [Aggregatilineales bacterium]|nr:hypothetical protein [Aggregatilineales bacterium]